MKHYHQIWIQSLLLILIFIGNNQINAQCAITPQITTNTCDVNGTPYDPTDDFYTVNVNATVTGTSSSQFTVSDGTTTHGPFTYGTGGIIPNLTPDSTIYTLTFVDATESTCIATSTTTHAPCCQVDVTAAPRAETMTGAANGEIVLCINSGIPPYTITTTPTTNASVYQVPGNCTQNYTISGLSQGGYEVLIVDGQGCQTTLSNINVNGPDCTDVLFSGGNGGSTSCHNSTDGTIEVTLFDKGNATAITVDVGNGLPTQTFTNLDEALLLTNIPAGEYNLAFYDNNGCQITYLYNPVTVTSPNAVLASVSSVNETAVDAANGQIDICATGGTAPYTYEISPQIGVVDSTGSACGGILFDSLTTGIYTLITTDDKGCKDTVFVTINNPNCSLQTTAPNVVHNICGGQAGGGIHFGITGGTAPYQVSLDGGQTYNIVQNTDSIQLTDLLSGSYDVIVKDVNNCFISLNNHTVITDENETISLNPTRNHVTTNGGNDGKIDLCINGGVAPYTLSVAGQTSVFVPQGGNSDCAETFLVENLPAGTYTLTITDNLGCEQTIQVEILEPSCASFETMQVTTDSITCFGIKDGSIQINLNSGTAPYTITIPGVQSVTTSSNTYTFEGLDEGTYEVFVTDASGCFLPYVVALELGEPEPLSTIPTSIPSCPNIENGILCLEPQQGTAPYTYKVKNAEKEEQTVIAGASECGGQFHVSGLPAGTYHIELIDAHGCKAHGMYQVSEVSIGVTADLTADCSTSGVDVGMIANTNAGGGTAPYTYQWNTGSTATDLANLPSGSYTVTVTDNRGCIGSHTFEVELQDVLIQSSSTPTCQEVNKGAFIAFATNGEPAYTWAWTGQGQTGTGTGDNLNLADLAIGNYSVTATDNRGCQATEVINIEEYDMIANLTPQNTCEGQNNGFITAASSTGMPNFSYNWSNGATTATAENLAAGTYTVTITDVLGCSATGSSIVEEYTLNPSFTVQNVCTGQNTGSILVNVENTTGTVSYNWSNQAQVNPLGNIGAGSYTVTVTDALGCTVTGTTTVSEFESPSVTASEDVSIVAGNSTTVSATVSSGANPYTYLWQPTGGENPTNQNYTVAPTSTTTYTVQVTDANGCTGTDQVIVTVLPQVAVQMPNAFSPNGDGENDTFRPYVPSGSVDFITFQVYDRWGVLLHDNPNEPWDGTYNNTKQPIGTYVYVLEYKDNLNATVRKKGHFSLIR